MTIGLGIVKGFGTTCGALASTVSHDSHNLTIVLSAIHPENALKAAQALIACGGGMSAVKDGELLHVLELPLAATHFPETGAKSWRKDSQKMKERQQSPWAWWIWKIRCFVS